MSFYSNSDSISFLVAAYSINIYRYIFHRFIAFQFLQISCLDLQATPGVNFSQDLVDWGHHGPDSRSCRKFLIRRTFGRTRGCREEVKDGVNMCTTQCLFGQVRFRHNLLTGKNWLKGSLLFFAKSLRSCSKQIGHFPFLQPTKSPPMVQFRPLSSFNMQPKELFRFFPGLITPWISGFLILKTNGLWLLNINAVLWTAD